MKEQHQRLSGLAAFSNLEETPVLQAFFLSKKQDFLVTRLNIKKVSTHNW